MKRLTIVGNLCNTGYNLFLKFKSQGDNPKLVVTLNSKAPTQWLPPKNSNTYYTTLNTSSLVDVWLFRRGIRLSNPDEIHAITLSPIYCQGLGVPLYSYATGSDMREEAQKNTLTGFLLRRAYRRSKAIFCYTPDLKHLAEKYNKKVYVITPYINEKVYKPDVAASKEFVFCPTRWDEIKRIDIAVKGYYLATKKGFSKPLVLVEDNNASVDVRALIDELGLQDKVVLIEKVQEQYLVSLYQSSICVLDQFGLGVGGLITLEAVMCGARVATYIKEEYKQHYPMHSIVSCRTPEEVADFILTSTTMEVKQ